MTNLVGDIFAYLSQGGSIMIPLMACSFVMWTLILDRIFFFSRLEYRDIELHTLVRILEPECPHHASPSLGRGRSSRKHSLGLRRVAHR